MAYRQIAERGLEGLRFGEVARGAGINNGTLLYYFPSKDALVQGVVGQLAHEFAVSQAPLRPEAADDPVAQLRAEFEDIRRRLEGQPAFAAVLVELQARSLRDRSVARLLAQLDDGWHAALVALVERGQAEGGFDPELDPSRAATTLMAVIRGIGWQVLTLDSAARDALIATAAEMAARWLVGAPRAARAPRQAGWRTRVLRQ